MDANPPPPRGAEIAREAQKTGVGNGKPAATFRAKRLIPVGILLAGIAAFFAFGLDRYVTFDTLREHRQELLDFVARQGAVAVLLYIVLYATSTALSLPGGLILSVAGGFLFGSIAGTVYVVTGATIGAVIVFLIAKTAFGDPLRAKAGPALKRMEAGFRDDAFNYMLMLRLIPLFPFFVVNIAPAFLGVPLRTYAIATFIGIIPGALVFVTFGAGLGTIIDEMEEFEPSSVLTTEIVAALIGLAVLALLPVAYKKIKARRTPGAPTGG